MHNYDKSGNRLCKGEFGATTSYGYSSSSNRLESSLTGILPRTYGYDDRGNITSINAQTFVYNDANRLASVDADATAYLYDGDGRRVTKTNAQTTYYFYDPSGRLLTEMVLGQASGGGTGEGHDYIHLPEGPLARIEWQVVPNPEYLPECSPTKDLCPPPRIAMMNVLYHHNDHLGTPIALTDKTGGMALHTEYLPFGEVFENTIASVENNLRFPGQHFDMETGLHQNWFRDYDPNTGRYRESDPIGVQGGANTYGYARANPVNRIDPKGLLDIFIGGLNDPKSRIVKGYEEAFSLAYPNRSSEYFTRRQSRKIIDAVRRAKGRNKCEPINLVGHSYGGATAASVSRSLEAAGVHVDLLITVDPVSRRRTRTPGAANWNCPDFEHT